MLNLLSYIRLVGNVGKRHVSILKRIAEKTCRLCLDSVFFRKSCVQDFVIYFDIYKFIHTHRNVQTEKIKEPETSITCLYIRADDS